MGKKKITDPDGSMEELIERARELAKAPFTPDRDASLPSLRSVATELGTTVIRARKLLITADYFSSPTATAVQRLSSAGKSIDEICDQLHLKPAAVYAYLPYEYRPYNLPETTANADRHKRYRATRKLRESVEAGEWSVQLWKTVIIFQDYPFQTSGRGTKPGTSYIYTVSKGGRSGHHYEGESIPGWGNEIWITTASGKSDRSISRSTVELGFRKYLEKDITGPRQLGVFGASYLLPLFQRFA